MGDGIMNDVNGGVLMVKILVVLGVKYIFVLYGGYLDVFFVVVFEEGLDFIDMCYEVMCGYVVDGYVWVIGGKIGVVVIIVGFGFINGFMLMVSVYLDVIFIFFFVGVFLLCEMEINLL